MLINVLGVRESSRLNIIFIVLDITTQLTLVVLGAILILGLNPGILFEHMFGSGNWPTTQIWSSGLPSLPYVLLELKQSPSWRKKQARPRKESLKPMC